MMFSIYNLHVKLFFLNLQFGIEEIININMIRLIIN
jgi:hypothetical protein